MPDRWVNPHGWGPSSPPGSGPPPQNTPPSPQRPSWGPPAGPPEGWKPPPPQQPPAWGAHPPQGPSTGGPWWRRWYVILAAALVGLGVVALTDNNDTTSTASQSTAPPTSLDTLPTVATTLETTSTSPPTTIAKIKVPTLVGLTLTKAKRTLADRGLTATTKYRSTAQYRAGTVISQSRKAGARVLPDTAVTLVVAKAPPPPPSTAPPPTTPARNCDPSYPDVCLDPAVEDYDCAGGSGNGPEYVEGPIRVLPPDPFHLDRDGDGLGCEDD